MSQRKMRMILVVVGACLCGIILFLVGNIIQKKDNDEFLKQCKEYEGTWENEKGTFSLEIYRVTSGQLAFSLHHKKFVRDVSLMTAYSVGDGYEFTYSAVRLAGKVYRIHAGNSGTGRIYLQEDKIRVDIPKIADRPGALEFQGILTKEKELPQEEVVHLMEYMNTKRQLPKKLERYCSLLYDEEGKVWRIRVVFNEDNCYRKTDVGGLSLCTFETECERELGTAMETYEVSGKLQKKVYEKGDFFYSIIRNEFGMVIEIDCQKRELPGTTRIGDFIMKGDTLLRYAGDYHDGGEIDLPVNVKRIASFAFEFGENGLGVSQTENSVNILTIPAGIFVEEDAFRNCGPLLIELAEGWKVVPKRAFAHTVSLSNRKEKKSWVTIRLPDSLERIEEEAFALDHSTEELAKYWQTFIGENNPSPPITLLYSESLPNITYIGDNALWGIKLSSLPKNATYLGKNITLSTMLPVSIPQGITKLQKDNFFLYGTEGLSIEIGRNLREIAEGAFRDSDNRVSYEKITLDKENPYFVLDEYGWLLSKDGKELYGISQNMLHEVSETTSRFGKRYTKGDDGFSIKEVRIPNEIEVIHDMAYVSGASGSVVVFPRSLKKISAANLSYWLAGKLCFPGNIPDFIGERDSYFQGWLEEVASEGVHKTFQVKKGDREKWLSALTEGMELSPKQKKGIKQKIVF